MKDKAINERYRFLIAKMQLDDKKFGDLIKVKRQTISKITTDINAPGFDTLSNTIFYLPFINAQWLITGTGPMTNKPEESISLLKEPSIQYKKRCDNCLELESRLKIAEDKQILKETLKSTRAELEVFKNKHEKRKVG